MLTVSCAELLSPKHYRPISLIKEFFQFPCQWSIPCQAHVRTHVGFQQSQAMPAVLQKAACCSAVLAGLQMKNTPSYFFCATSQKAAHIHRSGGGMVLSEGSKLSITHFSSAAERGLWKYRKNQQAGCTSAAPDTESKHQHTCLHAKLARHACTALQNWLYPSISSSSWLPFHPKKTQLKDSHYFALKGNRRLLVSTVRTCWNNLSWECNV